MINKRLVQTVSESKGYVAKNVILLWCALAANIPLMISITIMFEKLYRQRADMKSFLTLILVAVFSLTIRYLCTTGASKMSYLSSKSVKKTLRSQIYEKLLRLGSDYAQNVKTSEVVQVAVEGVDQLETYFGAYLPQFFYAMLAPLTLFGVLCFVNFPSALILLICVPLIPISIAVVQTWAKKLLAKYWGKYTALGDSFLENLQGLTTLKIYQSDEFKQQEMNRNAEDFRRITMKVLTMQLNSITIMDLVAYGGAALGMIVAVTQYRAGAVSLEGCLLIILLAADFFIPMRQLGSFFHIAMNGMAASEKIFKLLDLPERAIPNIEVPKNHEISCQNLSFSYTDEREILKNIQLFFPQNSFTALVGESGCGKSTIAGILTGKNRGYQGSVQLGKAEISNIEEKTLMQAVTYIGHNSYLFKGSIRDNLLMGKTDASDKELWYALKQTKLAEFIEEEGGLDAPLLEKGANLSGGQCQRLALARALLHDSPVYIFDETTSNIDVESENEILQQIHQLAKTKTVILISHRLANVQKANNIYVLSDGMVAESGTHEELLAHESVYQTLWRTQQSLENYGKAVVEHEKKK